MGKSLKETLEKRLLNSRKDLEALELLRTGLMEVRQYKLLNKTTIEKMSKYLPFTMVEPYWGDKEPRKCFDNTFRKGTSYTTGEECYTFDTKEVYFRYHKEVGHVDWDHLEAYILEMIVFAGERITLFTKQLKTLKSDVIAFNKLRTKLHETAKKYKDSALSSQFDYLYNIGNRESYDEIYLPGIY